MKSFEQRLLRELLDAGYSEAPSSRRSRRWPRNAPIVVLFAALLMAAGAFGALEVWPGGQGDKPTSPVESLRPSQPIGGDTVSVESYRAADGLCFRVRETTPDSSIACANVGQEPYVGARALGVVLEQERDRGVLLVGLAPRDADRVVVHAVDGDADTAVEPLPAEQPGADRLGYFVISLPKGSAPKTISALRAGQEVATVSVPSG